MRDIAVHELHILLNAEFLAQTLERQTIRLPILPQKIRMRGSEDNVNRPWIFFDNFWKGLDRIFDAFTRREEPKRE